MVKEVIYNEDGSTTEIDHPEPPLSREALRAKGLANYQASTRAKANALLRKGDVAGAQILLNKIGV